MRLRALIRCTSWDEKKYAALEKRIQTALSAYPYTSVLCACVHCRYAFSDFSFAVRDQTITIPA